MDSARSLRWIVAGAVLGLLLGCARELAPPQALEKAQALITAGEAGEARIVLKNLLVAHPQTIDARVLLAQLALDSGDVQAAEEELGGIERAQFVEASARVVRWRTDIGMGRHAEVLAALAAAGVGLPPEQIARLRASALRAAGAGADSIDELRALIAAEPANAALVVELAASLASIGNLQQAETELDAFLADPRRVDADALLSRGELRLRKGAADLALQDFELAQARAALAWPLRSRVAAEIMAAEATLALGRVAAAKEQVTAIERRRPGTVGARILLARIALLEGRHGDAADVLQGLAETMPGDARIQYVLVDALLRGGNLARATEILELRVKAAPEDDVARRMLARVRLEQSRPDEVVALLGRNSAEAVGVDAETDGLLSAARLAQQRAGVAISSLEAQLAHTPDDAQLRGELAAALLQGGEASRALSIARELRGRAATAASIAAEVGALRALGNDRELNVLIAGLVDGTAASIELLLAGADAAQRGGRSDAASRLVDRALEREPDHSEALLRRANLAFIDRRYDDARNTLQDLARSKPSESYALVALARVAEAQGDLDGAREALRKIIALEPQRLEPSLMLAALELRAEQFERAAQAMEQLIAAAPRDGVAANASGQLLLNSRRVDEARTRFRTAVEQSGETAEFWFNLGRTQLAADDRIAAGQSFGRAVALRPDWLDANIAAVRINVATGQLALARAQVDALTAALPGTAMVWQLAGEVSAAEGNMETASGAFAQSFVLRPSRLAALSEHQARLAGRLAKPEQPLVNWLAREAEDASVRRRLSDFYLSNGREAEALVQLERILAAEPNDVVVLNNLAWLLATRDVAKAEAMARRARAIAPGNPAIADTLGWVLIQAADYAGAVALLREAAAALPDDRSVRYHYALALAGAGDRQSARREVDLALAGGVVFSSRDAAQALALRLAKELS